jgi:hypothetical protein
MKVNGDRYRDRHSDGETEKEKEKETWTLSIQTAREEVPQRL